MTKNLDIIVVRKGNSVVTSGFQCAELLAQLFGLGQNRHIIGCAQGIGLGQHGGEIGILQIQQGQLLLGTGDLVILLQQNAADALEPDGEANGGHLLANELANHIVVAAAACNSAAELRAGHFKHHAGIVSLAAHQAGGIGNAVTAVGNLFGGGDDIAQVGGQGLVPNAGGHGVQAEIPGAQELIQRFHSGGVKLFFQQLFLYAVCTDLIQLVKADADGIQLVSGKAHLFQHGAQDAAVVDVDSEIFETDAQQSASGHIDQLHLGIGGRIAQNVDITLHKLAQAALLRALGTVNAVGLDHLEGGGQLVAVGSVVTGKRQGQVIAQAHIGKLLFIAGAQGSGQLFAALENLEDQVQVVAAIGFVQVFHILQDGGGNTLEPGGAVSIQNLALNVITQCLLARQKVAHALQRLCFHGCSSLLSARAAARGKIKRYTSLSYLSRRFLSTKTGHTEAVSNCVELEG